MSTNQTKQNPVPAGFVPNKALGQNFLSSDVIIEAILDAAQIEGKRVLEIGPGTGALTEGLLSRAGFLAAVEKDGRLCELLTERFGDTMTLMHADVLDADIPVLMGVEPWHAVGNLPYYATTPIVLRLLSLLPESMTLMVQKEAAPRFFAPPRIASTARSLSSPVAFTRQRWSSTLQEAALTRRRRWIVSWFDSREMELPA